MTQSDPRPRPNRIARFLRRLSLLLALLLFALIGAMVLLAKQQAHKLITNPSSTRRHDTFGMDYDSMTLTAEDGSHVSAWYIASENEASVILIHGYKGARDEMLNEALMLHNHGYGSIIIDLRAHGDSDGEQIRFGLSETQDVDAAYQYLLTRDDVDPERIGIIGNSMGANVSILYAADNPQIKALVANSSFASMEDEIAVGVEHFTGLPAFPFAPMIQFFAEGELGVKASDINAKAVVGQISPRPILIMHGGRDDTVPPDNGQKLYDAAGQPKELWTDPELGHTQFDTKRPVEYERRVIGLFDEYLLGK
jgi:uncharacterized protein